MNIFVILTIIFGVLATFSGALLCGALLRWPPFDNQSDDKKQTIAVCISLPLTFIFFVLMVAFLHFNNTKELFADSNYKEIIEYSDFVSVNNGEITYSKNGTFFTMQYNYKADDFDTKDGIQVYVGSYGTVGIR